MQYKQVLKVLEEIKADKIECIVLLNKIDRVKDNDVLLASLNASFPDAMHISAVTHEGFEELIARITSILLGTEATYILPSDRRDLAALARKNGTIIKEEWLDDGIHITARIQGSFSTEGVASSRTLALLAPYLVK